MNDIVTRLRNACAHLCDKCNRDNPYGIGDEAANEIKRLRDGILKYVTTISDCYCTPAMERDALELLKGVWRGE